MQLPARYCLICTFLYAPFFSNGQVDLGDSLLRLGDHHKAAIAYEVALFNGVPYEQTNSTLLKAARCYKLSNNSAAALQTLDAADFYSGSDSTRFLLFYEYSVNALLDSQPDVALSKLQELSFEITDTSLLHSMLLLEILTLNELQRWPEAQMKFKQLVGNNYPDPYLEILKFKKKNPDKAVTLSYWFPGVGQMYAGYFWKGLTSTLLNAGLVAFMGWSYLQGYYFSGVFTGAALFYLSYNGGARYAEVLANQYNMEVVANFNQKLREQITTLAAKK